MPTYDDTLFDPPAPLAKTTLRNPQNGRKASDVPMLLTLELMLLWYPKQS